MRTALEILTEARRPIAVGNVLVPVRAVVEEVREASYPEQLLLCAGIRGWLGPGLQLTPEERQALDAVLRRLPAETTLEPERQALLDLAARAPEAVSAPEVATANVLFLSKEGFRGKPFGFVQTLTVTASPTGPAPAALRHRAGDDALYLGWGQGVQAAKEFLRRQDLADFLGAEILARMAVEGYFPGLPLDVEVTGPSLALGAAMAVISAILDLPVPRSMAFTGRVEPREGRLLEVEGIPEKVAAAADKGLAVVLPADDASKVPSYQRPYVNLSPFDRLDQVVNAVFGPERVRPAVQELRARMLNRVVAVPPVPVVSGPGRRTVLLSCVAHNDPLGLHRDLSGRVIGQEEGPVLTMARQQRPDEAHLFYTTGPPGTDNDLRTNAAAVAEMLTSQGCSVHQHPLDGLQDPTDVAEIVRAIGAELEGLTSRQDPQAMWIVNVASGSPQMLVAWYLLVGWERLPPERTRLVHVRESRWAKLDGGPRVRTMPLPTPTILAARTPAGLGSRPSRSG
jgi:hypothetical protein